MNKAELIQAVAAQSGESKSTVERVLTGFEAAVSNELAAGGSVALSGFGSFAVADKPERPLNHSTVSLPFGQVIALLICYFCHSSIFSRALSE